MTRPRGVTVYPIKDPAVTGPFDHYALLVNKAGEVRMVHSEGVTYAVRDDKPWTWNDFDPACPKFTPTDLILATAGNETVDLADWVRTHNDRLECNFSLAYDWAVSP